MTEFFSVAKVSEIPIGGKKLVEADFIPIALFNVDGKIYAIEDVCTHDGGPLAEGELDGDQIECPRHGARFDVRTGKALRMPAYEDVEIFEVKIENGEIFVAVD